jgi:two-component system chemotaxis response regulator CheY
VKILIADDGATSRLIAHMALRSLGHECFAANDGAQAWETFQSVRPDVVISDWMMPGLEGIELCRRVRAAARSDYVYFIILTGLGEKSEIRAGIEAGADDYLLKPLDQHELHLRLLVAARITTLHAELAEKTRELERMNTQLAEQGRTDPLTQLGNRLRLNEDLQVLAARAKRHGQRYCAAMCDVDHFKRYNDTHGHGAGDEVLRRVAAAIRSTARDGDGVYRYGGEEFLLILPEQSLSTATLALERVRKAVEALAIPLDAERVVTISAGIAALDAGESGGVERMLKEADAALYRAKAAGRNNVQVADTGSGG